MILTGKTKEDFEKWLNKEMYYLGRHNFEDRDNNIEDLSDIFQNALIIEWFDSIGIYIEVYRHNNRPTVQGFNSRIVRRINGYYECCTAVDTRKEATEEAIKKANEIYNEKK